MHKTRVKLLGSTTIENENLDGRRHGLENWRKMKDVVVIGHSTSKFGSSLEAVVRPAVVCAAEMRPKHARENKKRNSDEKA